MQDQRPDIELFCPRIGKCVITVGRTCYSESRTKACCGCVMDGDFVRAQLLVLLCKKLNGQLGKTGEAK
jgi:hypothetical protein